MSVVDSKYITEIATPEERQTGLNNMIKLALDSAIRTINIIEIALDLATRTIKKEI